jgi:glycine cleavage system H protein
MSFDYPDDLKYSDSHEYVRLEGDIATIGITAFAVDQLGDIVFVELPEPGAAIAQDQSFGNVESVKAVEELIAPVSGTVIETNTAVMDAPEGLSSDPYVQGWLLKIQLSGALDGTGLMSAADYQAKVEGS